MDIKEMIELLKIGDIRVFDVSQSVYTISHTRNNTVIYFWDEYRFYKSYNNIEGLPSYDELVELLSSIVRIEKKFDSEYYPIWTKEDGLITQTEQFVRLKGRYYTITFLEQLIDKVKDLKKINL